MGRKHEDIYRQLTELAVDEIIPISDELTYNASQYIKDTWEREHPDYWIRRIKIGDEPYWIKGKE